MYLRVVSTLLLFTTVFTLSDAHAQETQANNNSVYSAFGLGMPHDLLSPYAAGMSMVGVAIPDRSRASLANPAFWGTSYFTSISTGMNLVTHEARDNFGSSSTTNLGFTQFQAQFPLLRERLGVSLALFPETDVRYSIFAEDEAVLPTADSLSAIGYRNLVTGNGGINRLEIGFGLRITENLFVGYAPSLMFGINQSDNQIVFDSSLYSPVRFVERTRYSGFAHRFGVMANTSGLFRNRDQLVVGATASLPVELNANRRVTNRVQPGGQAVQDLELIPEDRLGERKVTYPFETTIGISYFPSRFLVAAVEMHYQQWSDHNSFDGSSDDFMTDRIRLGAGIEYDRFSLGNTGLFNSLIYRFGVSYDDGHLNINNTDIETFMVSAGIGIPFGSSSRNVFSSLDVSVDYGIRGTTNNDLVRERIFGLRVSLNLSELMFLQRRVN